MNELYKTIIEEFQKASNKTDAIQMAAYMKNNFYFFGIKSPIRKNIQSPFMIKKYLIDKSDMKIMVKQLWNEPQRELHYFAQEYAFKYLKQTTVDDIEFYEWLIINKSWWDTVDFVAPKLIANYFKMFPEKRAEIIDRWINSNNIWLQRSSILFQLKYKEATDLEMLSYIIKSLSNTKEFFINKSIGWVLREYGKTNPEWVINFCEANPLSKLSNKEALRIINKTHQRC